MRDLLVLGFGEGGGSLNGSPTAKFVFLTTFVFENSMKRGKFDHFDHPKTDVASLYTRIYIRNSLHVVPSQYRFGVLPVGEW